MHKCPSIFALNAHASKTTQTAPIVKLEFTCCPRVKTKAGNRAFSMAASNLWNTLPDNIKSAEHVITFRRHVKTYLFNITYPH